MVIELDEEEEELEDYTELGQKAKLQDRLLDRNLAVLIWGSALPSFVNEERVPLTDAWCKGWGLPSIGAVGHAYCG